MKITYDPEVDAAYIRFKPKKAELTTVRLSEDIAVDFGPNEEIWGIEILDASKHFGLTGKDRKLKVKVEDLI
jgi:uncharacterized protein YuzE